MILQSTPVLFVDRIEPSERFFEKLGFSRTVEVPEGDGVGFVILSHGDAGGNDGLGLMLQTRSSAAADLSEVDPATFDGSGTHLFMSVADIGAAEKALEGHDRFFERRETFYGATETGYVEPGGHHVTVAQFAARSPDEA